MSRDRRASLLLRASLILRAKLFPPILIALGTASCATRDAPVIVAPPTVSDQVAWILRLEDERRLEDPPPPEPPADPGPQGEGNGDSGAAQVPAVPPAPPPLRPSLFALLEAPEPYVRRRAALAVGRVGQAEGVEPLIARLADREPEVRQMAAFALGLIGDPTATDALVESLRDVSAKVQGRAARALARIGAAATAPAVGAMVGRYVTGAFGMDPEDLAYPHSDEVEAFRSGLYALGELGAYEPLADAVIGDAEQPVLWWWPVSYALGRTGDNRALSPLATLSGVVGSHGVALAADGLGALGDPEAIEPLVELLDLDRRDHRVVTAAVRALGAIDHPDAIEALDRFVRIRRLDEPLRRAAIDALARHGATASIEVFIELLGHPSPYLRAASVRALAAADPQSFVFVLSGLGTDSDWRVRQALADALRHVDPAGAIPRLWSMLEDDDARVVRSVLEALAAIDPPDLPGLLIDRLQAEDVTVRAAAARLLGARCPAGSAGALAEAYAAAESNPSYVARAAIARAIGLCGGEGAVATLRKALADRDWAVRVAAAAGLEGLDPTGDHQSAIRPAPGLRRVDYSAPHLVSPEVSPHVYVETRHGTIEIELAVLDAPLAAESFMTLARDGYYDGLTFHRVERHQVAYAGDPRGDGSGGPGYTLRDELNQRPFLRGTVGIAREAVDTGGSRFFITLSPQPQFDGRYTVLGTVVAGMEAADAIEEGDRMDRVLVWDGVQPFRGAEDDSADPADGFD
ncbi:MAG: hypothetical protein F4W89_05300 [Acidobacteria bacterium]|nr:hypothetical protein [Acidobacteriota bacterium]